MTGEYRVVFRGDIIEGFDPAAVRESASRKLKASEDQITRIFAARTAVLKKRVDRAIGERYVAELRNIGMNVQLEDIPATAEAACAPSVTPAPPSPGASDMEKTQLADANALAAYLNDAATHIPVPVAAPATTQGPEVDAVHAGTWIGSPDALNQYVEVADAQLAAPDPAPARTEPVFATVPETATDSVLPLQAADPAPAEESARIASPFGAADALQHDEPAPVEAAPAPGFVQQHRTTLMAAGVLIVVLLLALWML